MEPDQAMAYHEMLEALQPSAATVRITKRARPALRADTGPTTSQPAPQLAVHVSAEGYQVAADAVHEVVRPGRMRAQGSQTASSTSLSTILGHLAAGPMMQQGPFDIGGQLSLTVHPDVEQSVRDTLVRELAGFGFSTNPPRLVSAESASLVDIPRAGHPARGVLGIVHGAFAQLAFDPDPFALACALNALFGYLAYQAQGRGIALDIHLSALRWQHRHAVYAYWTQSVSLGTFALAR